MSGRRRPDADERFVTPTPEEEPSVPLDAEVETPITDRLDQLRDEPIDDERDA